MAQVIYNVNAYPTRVRTATFDSAAFTNSVPANVAYIREYVEPVTNQLPYGDPIVIDPGKHPDQAEQSTVAPVALAPSNTSHWLVTKLGATEKSNSTVQDYQNKLASTIKPVGKSYADNWLAWPSDDYWQKEADIIASMPKFPNDTSTLTTAQKEAFMDDRLWGIDIIPEATHISDVIKFDQGSIDSGYYPQNAFWPTDVNDFVNSDKSFFSKAIENMAIILLRKVADAYNVIRYCTFTEGFIEALYEHEAGAPVYSLKGYTYKQRDPWAPGYGIYVYPRLQLLLQARNAYHFFYIQDKGSYPNFSNLALNNMATYFSDYDIFGNIKVDASAANIAERSNINLGSAKNVGRPENPRTSLGYGYFYANPFNYQNFDGQTQKFKLSTTFTTALDNWKNSGYSDTDPFPGEIHWYREAMFGKGVLFAHESLGHGMMGLLHHDYADTSAFETEGREMMEDMKKFGLTAAQASARADGAYTVHNAYAKSFEYYGSDWAQAADFFLRDPMGDYYGKKWSERFGIDITYQ